MYTGVTDETGGVAHTFTDTYFDESELGNFTDMLPGILDVSYIAKYSYPPC